MCSSIWFPLLVVVAMTSAQVHVEEDGRIVKVKTSDGQVLDFHAEWLRERCQSSKFVDIATKQPQVSPHEYESPRVKKVQLLQPAQAHESIMLGVEFTDGHIASFEYEHLLQRAAAELRGDQVGALMQTHQAPKAIRKFWNSSFSPPLFDYENVAGGTEENDFSLLQLTAHLLSDGIVIIRGVPRQQGECEKMARLLSTLRTTEWGRDFDIKYMMEKEKNQGGKQNGKGKKGTTSDASEKKDEKKDLAYTGTIIGMHTDNAYRYPTPDFQSLHAIEHCTCDHAEPNYKDTHNCPECVATNYFVDGLEVAQLMATETPDLYNMLTTTMVRFENDGGGGKSSLYHVAPILELNSEFQMNGCTGAACVGAIRFSAKSGGYVPLGTKNIDTFYAARRRFSTLAHDPNQHISLQLRPGDMVVFDNKRILHSRSALAATDGKRHLQGCYFDRDGLQFQHERLRRAVLQSKSDTVAFRSLAEGSKADFDLMTAEYVKACNGTQLASRAFHLLSLQDSPATMLGARVSLFEHGLQTATRALRAGEDDETVVIGLLHDIGELLSPTSHGDVANGILRPYISPKSQWILKMHEIFQGYHYFHHVGGNRNQRDDYKDHEFYEACKKFCDVYDQTSFDDAYVSLPLEAFRPLVEKIFSRKAYWWQPDHPKAMAVTG